MPRLTLGTLAAAGAALHQVGNPALAVDVFGVALDAAPGDPDLLTSLASAARAKGDTARRSRPCARRSRLSRRPSGTPSWRASTGT